MRSRAYFSPDPKLQMYRCDVALNSYAEPGVSLSANRARPGVRLAGGSPRGRRRRSSPIRATAVCRARSSTASGSACFGHGIVANPDEMDGKPWSPGAARLAGQRFRRSRLRHQAPDRDDPDVARATRCRRCARTGEPPARGYVFAGPEVRRLTAEQFADAIGAITGEWNAYPVRPGRGDRRATRRPLPSMPPRRRLRREWRVASSNLTRALGPPDPRSGASPSRSTQASTLQALELVNGEILTRWLSRGARRMLGELPPEPAEPLQPGRRRTRRHASAFDVDVSKAHAAVARSSRRTARTCRNALQPAWAQAELVGPAGADPLSSSRRRSTAQGCARNGTDRRRAARPAATAFACRTRPCSSTTSPGKGFTRSAASSASRIRRRDRLDAESADPVLRLRRARPDMDGCCRRAPARRCRRRRR